MPLILRFTLAASLLLMASFAGCISSAQQADDRITLRAVYGDFYPYSFTAPDGTAQGYVVDVTR